MNKDNIIVGSAQVSVDGVNIGYTQGGVTLRKQTEWFDVDADQMTGIAKKVPTLERMFVSFTMLEATYDNLQRALNEPDANVNGSDLSFGCAAPVADEHTLTITGKAPGSKTRTYTIYRAVAVEDVEHVVGARDQAGAIPVGFELLKDSAHSDHFGTFSDA